MSLAKNIPKDLADLFQAMATDFPEILRENLVGIYLWGSLTYDAFDEECSDIDCVVVTARDLDDREFSELDEWFKKKGEQSRWVKRIDMRFVIDHEFLDKASRCCGFHHYAGKLARHGSDGNPIIWMNIAQSGVTLWGENAKLIAPHLYSAYHGKLVSKDQAYGWAMETVPPMWRSVIHAATENRLKNSDSTTPELEQGAMRFVSFVSDEVKRIFERSSQI
ncbi:MAG: aminoglycoside adenylyltransferase domain-containing protein [Candidatus Sulfotelmatobacter sp.]